MKTKFLDSLKTQIILFIIVAITLSTGLVAGVILYFNYDFTLSQMGKDGIAIAEGNAMIIENIVKEDDSFDSVQQSISEVAKSQNLKYCNLISVDYINVCDSEQSLVGKTYKDKPCWVLFGLEA